MASGHVLSLCCSSMLSGSMQLSVLQPELSPLLSPFTRTTSLVLLNTSLLPTGSGTFASPDAALPPAAETTASVSACAAPSRGSASEFAPASRFSLLLERRCLLLSWGRRSRPGLRPPPLLFGLPEGLLLLLNEGADFLLEAGEAEERQKLNFKMLRLFLPEFTSIMKKKNYLWEDCRNQQEQI